MYDVEIMRCSWQENNNLDQTDSEYKILRQITNIDKVPRGGRPKGK